MSKIFAPGHRFFSVPQSLFHLEEIWSLSAKPLLLLLWLYNRAQRYSSNSQRFTNRQLAEFIKVHENRIPSIRNRLLELKLLRAERDGDRYVYVLMSPTEGVPIDVPVTATTDWEDTALATVAHVSGGGDDTSREVLKLRYESFLEQSPEELTITAALKACRKDPVRTAELKEKRAALQALRKDAREKAKRKYEKAIV